MSCQCQTQTATVTGAGVDVMSGAGSSTSANSLTVGGSTVRICNRCLFFWIAVAIAVLFLLKRS